MAFEGSRLTPAASGKDVAQRQAVRVARECLHHKQARLHASHTPASTI